MLTITRCDRARACRFAAALDGSAVTDPKLAALMHIVSALRAVGSVGTVTEDFWWTLRARLVAAA